MTAAELTSIAPRDHVVQFYDGAPELVGRAGEYLRSSLVAGGAAVVLATPSHQEAFQVHLARSGVDIEAALSAGTLVLMDARRTLDRLLVDGRPDSDRFDAVVGPIIARALEAGSPVHAYGEMVSLLWEAGENKAAIELEGCWNGLGSQLPFSLYCAYHLTAESPHGPADLLQDVCGMHSGLLGAPPGAQPWPGRGVEVSRRFPAAPRSPRDARYFVLEALHQWRMERLGEDAAVIVTEMATNAVVHAHSEFEVHVRLTGDVVRVSVSDLSPEPPVDRAASRLATSGRGVRLVAELTRRWGIERRPPGKSVWAELAPG